MKCNQVLGLLAVFVLFGCQTTALRKQNIQGKTMGTTYHISYYGELHPTKTKQSLDSLLVALNKEVSTYIPTSTISQFNDAVMDTVIVDKIHGHFWNNYLAAKKIYGLTDGFFDPTVMPLVNYWGFGYKGHKPVAEVDSMKIDSLRKLVGFNKLSIHGDTIFKENLNTQLDFSALAKGYGVDLVAAWFDKQGVNSYFIEIGGENLAKGRKPNNQVWTVGISVPREDASLTEYKTVVELDNRAMATSGNYRNYYEMKGQKYSHTINPKTGFSERNSLLSVSVIGDDCMNADALATAMMTMGYENAKKIQDSLDGFDFILKIGLPNGLIKTEFSNPQVGQ